MKNHARKKMEKMASLVLAILMLLTMVPAGAFAVAEEDTGYNAPAYDVPEAVASAAEVEAEIAALSEGMIPADDALVWIEITTVAQLQSFLQGGLGPNNANYRLNFSGAGITFAMGAQTPTQGRGFVDGQPFTGIFDGNGHTITGFRLRRQAGLDIVGNVAHNTSVGLIRAAGSGARIQNLTVQTGTHTGVTNPTDDNAGFWGGTGAASANLHAGMLVGRVVSGGVVIENVRLQANGTAASTMRVTANAATTRMGGMVGHVNAGAGLTMRDVHVEALDMVTAAGRTHSIGGLVGSSAGTMHITTSPGEARNRVNISARGSGRYNADNNAFRVGGVLAFQESGNVLIENTDVGYVPNAIGGQGLNRFLRTTNYGGGFIARTNSGSTTIRNADNYVNISASRANHRIAGFIGRAGATTVLENVENHGFIRLGDSMAVATTVPAGTPFPASPSVGTNQVVGGGNLGGIIGRADGITTIRGAENYGAIQSRPGGTGSHTAVLGGIVGWANNRITITDAENHGNVNRFGGGVTRIGNAVGGIIGRVQHGGSAANRRMELINVENHGGINNENTPRYNAGGIVGYIRDRASAVNRITNAINTGVVRANRNAGGIIGHADSRNTHITGAMNYGMIETVNTRSGAGGLVGRSNRRDMIVRDSGNIGEVRGTATHARGGTGGLVGRSTAAGFRIERSFNQGYVNSTGFNTGGLLGLTRAASFLQDVYNIGTVHTTAARGGSGLVGRRTSGNITIQNAFVSSGSRTPATGGVAVGVSAAGTNNNTERQRPVAGFTFRNVFVDTSTMPPGDNDVRWQGGRNGINPVTTELITSGLLPGINSGPWRIGIEGVSWEDQRTFPYFTWQTGGVQQAQFFNQIEPFMDTPRDNVTAASFVEVRNPLTARFFNPYRPLGTTRDNGAGVFRTWPLGTGQAGEGFAARATTAPMSVGLISTDHVVGFSVGEIPERFTVVGVDVDTLNPENRDEEFVIEWATFDSAMGGVTVSVPGIFIGEVLHAVPGATTIYVSATGYAPVAHVLTAEEIASGEVRVPMTRVPIEVYVYVRGEMPEDDTANDETNRGPILANSWMTRDGEDVTRVGNNFPLLPLPDVLVRQELEASAPGFTLDSRMINPLDFRRNEDGSYYMRGGRFVLDINLEDIRLPDFAIETVERVNAPDTDDGYTIARILNIAQRNLVADDPRVAPTWTRNTTTLAATGGTDTAQRNNQAFHVVGATEETEFQVFCLEGTFAPSDVYLITEDCLSEAFGPDGGGTRTQAGVFPITLQRLGPVRNLYVYEEFVLMNGGDIVETVRRRIDATALIDGFATDVAMRPGVGAFTVRAALDQIVTAEAPGFATGEYTISDPNSGDITIVLHRLPPPTGFIHGHVFSVADSPSLPYGIGDPVEDATVHVRAGALDGEIVRTATTDETGFYTTVGTEALSPGRYYVSAFISGYVAVGSHHNPILLYVLIIEEDGTETREELDTGAIADVFMTWTLAFDLEVTVTGPENPMGDVTLRFNEAAIAQEATMWATRGNLEAPMGQLIAWATGYRPATAVVNAASFTENRGRLAQKELDLEPIELEDDLGGIQGFVFGTEGARIEDAHVTIVFPDGTTRSVTTDVLGYYEILNLAPDRHTIIVTHYDYAPKVVQVDVEEGEMTWRDIQLVPRSGDDPYYKKIAIVRGDNTANSVTIGDNALTAVGETGNWQVLLTDGREGGAVAATVDSGYRWSSNPATVTEGSFDDDTRLAIVVITVVAEHALTVANLPAFTERPDGQTENGVRVVGEALNLTQGNAGPEWTFLGWTTEPGDLEIGYPVTGLLVAPPTTMPNGTLTVTAVWGNEAGLVGIPNSFSLQISNVPAQDPRPMGQTVSGMREFGTAITLTEGTAPAGMQFLGWTTYANAPEAGDDVSEFDYFLSAEELAFNMPAEALHFVAVWGNAAGIVGGSNSFELTITNVPAQDPRPMGQTV
ncbi:MAG: carboxypeptidase-like regulatory domain-containing protein, partial [Oscillospiraceae bacterium]|nr:carboxypeptidase-like regulatory domain-containing protein [Oscillospiraceae bacterium]